MEAKECHTILTWGIFVGVRTVGGTVLGLKYQPICWSLKRIAVKKIIKVLPLGSTHSSSSRASVPQYKGMGGPHTRSRRQAPSPPLPVGSYLESQLPALTSSTTQNSWEVLTRPWVCWVSPILMFWRKLIIEHVFPQISQPTESANSPEVTVQWIL